MNNSNVVKEPSKSVHHPPTLGIGIFGGIVGAAIGSVASLYLSDPKNREQLRKQILPIREKVIKVMDTFSEQEKKQDKIVNKLDDLSEEVHTKYQ